MAGYGTGGQANAIDRDAGAGAKIVKYHATRYVDRAEIARVFDFDHFTDFFNDSCEHMPSRRDPGLSSSPSNL